MNIADCKSNRDRLVVALEEAACLMSIIKQPDWLEKYGKKLRACLPSKWTQPSELRPYEMEKLCLDLAECELEMCCQYHFSLAIGALKAAGYLEFNPDNPLQVRCCQDFEKVGNIKAPDITDQGMWDMHVVQDKTMVHSKRFVGSEPVVLAQSAGATILDVRLMAAAPQMALALEKILEEGTDELTPQRIRVVLAQAGYTFS